MSSNVDKDEESKQDKEDSKISHMPTIKGNNMIGDGVLVVMQTEDWHHPQDKRRGAVDSYMDMDTQEIAEEEGKGFKRKISLIVDKDHYNLFYERVKRGDRSHKLLGFFVVSEVSKWSEDVSKSDIVNESNVMLAVCNGEDKKPAFDVTMVKLHTRILSDHDEVIKDVLSRKLDLYGILRGYHLQENFTKK